MQSKIPDYNKDTVVIAGATGFLGSHITRKYVTQGYRVIALKRNTSDLSRCRDFEDRTIWICIDNADWGETVKSYQPKVIINAAWDGVNSHNRDNWDVQISNLYFTQKLLNFAVNCSVSKYIGLGSQAEYGFFSETVTEEHPCRPVSAYGTVKCTCSNMTRIICEENNINWYWLRLFSIYGEGESEQWLIPSLIKRMLTDKSMDFTACEQKYDYLYAGDMADAIVKLSEKQPPNGCYNLCSSTPRILRKVVTSLRNMINPAFILNFGALPYRPNQTMTMVGNNSKYENEIGEISKQLHYIKDWGGRFVTAIPELTVF